MNANQERAATSAAPWNIVLAGPGSGKTTVVIKRAKHLSSKGVPPAELCCVTFTNIAANVMRRRLTAALGSAPGYVGTLHGMMFGALRRQDSRWTLVCEADAEEFIGRQAKLLGYRGTDSALSSARIDNALPKSPAARVVRAYRQFMRSEHLLDFDMVLTEGWKLIQSGAALPWSHYFVDEFQDSAAVDAEIYLSINPKELMIVADPDQSIFAFRGACPSKVTDFWNDPRFFRHVLDLNYRCAPEICDVANAVIAPNADRLPKQTVSAGSAGVATVDVQFYEYESEEQAGVCAMAREWVDAGMAPVEVAVLCRTNRLASEMAEALAARGLPAAAVESERKPKDWRLLTLLLSQIASPSSWAVARLFARERAKMVKADPAVAEADLEALRASTDASPARFWALPSEQVILSLNADLTRFGVSRGTQAMMAERIRLYEPATIAELLEAMRESPGANHVRGINCLTVHAAKGAEFDGVIVAGTDLFRGDDMDEERRLMFVAVTRARSRLAVTYSHTRTVTLQNGRTIPASNDGRGREIFRLLENTQTINA
jgi:DNA helicase-2/ATP-dependent DNA helicase PcrA